MPGLNAAQAHQNASWRLDGVREVEVGGQALTVWWLPGARSSLDGMLVGEGRDVGRHVSTFWFAWISFHPDTRVLR